LLVLLVPARAPSPGLPLRSAVNHEQKSGLASTARSYASPFVEGPGQCGSVTRCS